MESPRWNIITPSQYEWERRGLDFIRAGLPDHDPYRAWANFEFQTADGAIYEVDLLVLTKQGFWLVEIKSWPGRVSGDAGTWTRKHEGKTKSEDNPVLLTNRKSKALISLLKAQQAVKKVRVPWMDALVFLSADDLQCDLTGPARNRVLLKDRPAKDSRPERKGILAALLNREGRSQTALRRRRGADPYEGGRFRQHSGASVFINGDKRHETRNLATSCPVSLYCHPRFQEYSGKQLPADEPIIVHE